MGHRSDLVHKLQFAKHCRYEHLTLYLNHWDIFFLVNISICTAAKLESKESIKN